MATLGGTSPLLRSEISTPSIPVQQNVSSTQTATQQQTPYFTPKSQISTQNLAPMQTEMPELVLPLTSSEIDEVVESEQDKKTKKRFANQSMVIEELGNKIGRAHV